MTSFRSTVPGHDHLPATSPPPAPPGWQFLDRAAMFSSSLELGAFPGTVSFARHHTRDVLGEWGLGELADDAESVAAELVANAVQETLRSRLDTPVRLTLLAGLRTALIAVWDATDGEPVTGARAAINLDNLTEDDATDPDQQGRGLMMVEALSFRWGHRPVRGGQGGKVVWSELRAQRQADRRMT